MSQYAQFTATGITLGAVYALVGLGFVLIYQVTGVINFAQGEFVMLGALVFALLEENDVAPIPAAALAVLVAVAVGAAVERLCLRPARRATTEALIIITIGVSIAIKGIVLVQVGTGPHFARSFSTGPPLRILGAVVLRQYLWVIGVAAIAVLLLWLFFEHTLVGKAMRACAMNPDAARLHAVSPSLMSLLAFALAAALGGLGGVILAPIQNPDYGIGLGLGLKGFTAAVVGGLESPSGAVAGGLLLGVVESLAAGRLSSGYKDAVAFGILLVVLLVRPTGIFSRITGQRV